MQDYFPNRDQRDAFNHYRIEYPNPEDYVISMLVNPCGTNGTHDGLDKTMSLGYDCCMNRFGQGEYGFLKFDDSDGGREMTDIEVFEKRLLAEHDEVLHNIIAVDEHGVAIQYEYSRRADDHTLLDEMCRGLRDPYPSCLQNRLKAIKSPYTPSCWDHNQTVDATLRCYTPDGRRKSNCMQVSYSQNAFINLCGGDFANDDRCGTFIEIHRENGSPYDSQDTILADTEMSTVETNGMYTTTIDLTYKGDKDRLLCAYQETKIRVGSMVRVVEESPQCCCPPKYNRVSTKGSFFCPKKPFTDDGPFADRVDLLAEKLARDEARKTYPRCPWQKEDEDMIICSKEMGEDGDIDSQVLEAFSGSARLIYAKECEEVKENTEGLYSSNDLHGTYSLPCPIGEAFKGCGIISDDSDCHGDDFPFSFRNRIGKVVRLPDVADNSYGVSFNDGRTVYGFPEYHLKIQMTPSNYELWFVQRNRFEKILQKKKGFRVIWPLCTFDPINDRYVPFAQVSDNGEIRRVLRED